MQGAYHLCGGAPLLKKLKLAATVANPGVIIKGAPAASGANVIPVTTTANAETYGLGIDAGTYSTTQGATEGMVTTNVRPDLIVSARMSGAATDGTSLTVMTNTAASAGGTTCTSADAQANDQDGGTMWCISGNNVGLSRTITTHNASTSVVCTVPFPYAIAVGDQFLMCPWSVGGDGVASGGDGVIAVQTTTLFLEGDATIASATGLTVAVLELILAGAANSHVLFKVTDHVYGGGATAF